MNHDGTAKIDPIADLCEKIPELREMMQEVGRSMPFELALRRTRTGEATFAQAAKEVGLPYPDEASNSRELSELGRLGLDDGSVSSSYQCPAVANEVFCGRRSERGLDGREPWCHLHGRTMELR